MSKIRRTLASIAMALIMLAVALVPLADCSNTDVCADTDADIGTELKDSDKPRIEFDENGNMKFSFPYMERLFNMGSRPATPVGDPSMGMIDITPQEIHYYDGNYAGMTNVVIDQLGSQDYYKDRMSAGINRGIEFSALFTDDAVNTGKEDLLNYGINASSPQNMFFLQGAGGYYKVLMGPDTAYRSYVLNNYLSISPMQSVNLLPHAVGDFTGDGSEEIALFMGDCVEFYDYADNPNDDKDEKTNYNYLNVRLDQLDPYGHQPMLNPVSMSAGDVDGDGKDELVVAVEYSEVHGSPFDVANNEHQTLVYMIDPADDTCRSSQLYFEHDYYHDNGDGTKTLTQTEYLNSVMTSVCLDNIDNDPQYELVVGGYMWDNARLNKNNSENGFGTYYKVTQDYRNYTGELYLGILDPADIGTPHIGPNVLARIMDDPQEDGDLQGSNGPRADYRYGGDTYLHENAGDTSIFLDDGAENDFGYCRSNSWMNWTVPMIVLDMDGAGLRSTVYFDNTLYYVDETLGFTYREGLKMGEDVDGSYVGHEQDNNNCCLIGLDKGMIHPRGDDMCMAYEDLFRFMAMDQRPADEDDRHTDQDATLWFWDVHSMKHVDDKGLVLDEPQLVRTECDPLYYHITEWEAEGDPAMCCPLNYDPTDSMKATYLSTMNGMTDPVVLAAISGIPYDDDLASIVGGAQNIGTTDFTTTQESSTGTETSVSNTYNFSGGLESMFISNSAGGGWSDEIVDSRTQSIAISYTWSSAHDSVAMFVTPFYCYNFLVVTGVNSPYANDGKVVNDQIIEIQSMYQFLEPVNVTLGYEEYVEFVEVYNDAMDKYAESQGTTFDPLITIEFDHIEGQIDTYLSGYQQHEDGTNIASASVGYRGDGKDSMSGVTLSCSTETGNSVTSSDIRNSSLSGGAFHMSLEYEHEHEDAATSIETLNNSMEFAASFNSGFINGTEHNKDELRQELVQYSMGGLFWVSADEATFSDDGSLSQGYMMLGYTVSEYGCGPKIGTAEADILHIDEEDEDIHNPTSEDIFVEVTIPGNVRANQLAHHYSLEMFYGGWVDVTNIQPMYHVHAWVEMPSQNGGDPEYVLLGSDEFPTLKPEDGTDQSYWIKVSGLNHLETGGYYEFRLAGYDIDGNYTVSDPTLGLLDTTTVVPSEVTVGDGIVDLFPVELRPGSNVVVGDTGLPGGTRTNVVVHDPDSDREYRFDNVLVTKLGFVVLNVEHDDSGDVPLGVTLFVFLGILVCLGAGWTVIRKN